MDRRSFLKMIGVGAAAVSTSAAGIVLLDPEPVRRFWQVGRNAPVGSLFGVECSVYPVTFPPPISDEVSWITSDHGLFVPNDHALHVKLLLANIDRWSERVRMEDELDAEAVLGPEYATLLADNARRLTPLA